MFDGNDVEVEQAQPIAGRGTYKQSRSMASEPVAKGDGCRALPHLTRSSPPVLNSVGVGSPSVQSSSAAQVEVLAATKAEASSIERHQAYPCFTRLPGQSTFDTSSGWRPVNDRAALLLSRSVYSSQAVAYPSSPSGLPPNAASWSVL